MNKALIPEVSILFRHVCTACHLPLWFEHLPPYSGVYFYKQVQYLLWLPINQNLQHLLQDFLALITLCGFLTHLLKTITNYMNEHEFHLSKLHTPLSQLFSQEQLHITYSRPGGRTFQRIKDTWDPDTTITSNQKTLQTYPQGFLHFTCPKLFFLCHFPWEMKQPNTASSLPQSPPWPLPAALGVPHSGLHPHTSTPKTPTALFGIRGFNNSNILLKRDERVRGEREKNIWNMSSGKSILDCRSSHKL